MRVFYLGRFEHSWSTETYVRWALIQEGHHVISWVPCPLSVCWGVIQEQAPDVVLFTKARVPGVERLITRCRDERITTACWLWDLYWEFRSENTIPPQAYSDLLFSTDGGHDFKWIDHGCNHYVLRQGIHGPDHELHLAPYRYDVGFVGGVGHGYHPDRNRLVKWLERRHGSRFRRVDDVREKDLNDFVGSCKIIVGDSYPSDYYWSNRIYEVVGRGGFLLHPRTIGLDEEFTDGVHYRAYTRNDYIELGGLIDYYTTNSEHRLQIRDQGFDMCGMYTYTNRVRELIDAVRRFRTPTSPDGVARSSSSRVG